MQLEQSQSCFPVYIPKRDMLLPDHELFILGNAERELLAKQATLQVTGVSGLFAEPLWLI